MSSHLEMRVTAGTREEAENVVDAVVRGRLAAGAQIMGPIVSVFWWKGEIERAEEFLVLMKTVPERLDELVATVRRVHSYETPEIVAVPLMGGSDDYLRWITEETTSPS